MNANETKKRRVKFAACVLEFVTLLVVGIFCGNHGMTYFVFAMEAFLLFWSVTGKTLDDVLGKILRGKISKGQYKNASKMKKSVTLFQAGTGCLAVVLLFVLSDFIGERILGLSYCVPVLCMFAPVLLLRMFSALLVAFFQGDGDEFPTVVGAIIRQILKLIFVVLFCILFENYGEKVANLLKQSDYKAMYGAMGAALAYGISEVAVLGYLFFSYRIQRKGKEKGNSEGMRTTDSFVGQVRILLNNLFPANFLVFLLQLPLWIGLVFYVKATRGTEALYEYGIFLGKMIPVLGIIIFPLLILLLENAGKVAICVRREERRYAKGYFRAGMHVNIIYSSFLTVFLFVFAPQLADFIDKDASALLQNLLRVGAAGVFLCVIGYYFSEILIRIGGRIQVIAALIGWNILFVILFLVFFNTGKMGVLSVVYALMISGAVYLVLTGGLLLSQTKMNIDWTQGVAIPVGTVLVIALIMLFADRFMAPHLGGLLTVVLNLVLGYGLYMVCLLLIGNFSEQEFSYMPGGGLIKKMAETLRTI